LLKWVLKMNIFGIGIQEFFVIFLICFIIFGPNKLPEIGRSLGKATKEFKDSIKEIDYKTRREVSKDEEGSSAFDFSGISCIYFRL